VPEITTNRLNNVLIEGAYRAPHHSLYYSTEHPSARYLGVPVAGRDSPLRPQLVPPSVQKAVLHQLAHHRVVRRDG